MSEFTLCKCKPLAFKTLHLQSEQVKFYAMAVTGSSSLKRSKPNYIYSVIGVAIVLFIMGIMGWLFLNLHSIGDNFKEDIRISVYLRTSDKNAIGKVQQYIASQPYAKNVEYVNKEKAKAIWNKENNEEWAKILDVNPLPESVDFFAKADYVNPDSLANISATIENTFKNEVADIQYPKSLVTNLNERATKIGVIFLVMSIILCIIVIISIDNTIRLAMFSNRFLIKTKMPSYPKASFKSGVNLFVCNHKLNPSILSGVKHLNRLENIVARQEWTSDQYGDGILLDHDGHVIECISSNIFMRIGKIIYTPKISHVGIKGVTRGLVVQISDQLGFKVKELIGGIEWWKFDGYATEGKKGKEEGLKMRYQETLSPAVINNTTEVPLKLEVYGN